ncbi:MAG: four helix bundle protein [Bacteroidaceae bacterium]|nr:four helix bundle protein [Bacteroidaceae bacterium]
MDSNELKTRLKDLAIRVIKMVDSMPRRISSDAIAKQVVRSGTSPSANYRAALLGKSDKDFLNKLKMVEEELDETLHWLEIIMETEMLKPTRVEALYNECHELLKIIVSTITSMRRKMDQ